MSPINSIFSGKELEEKAKKVSLEEKQLYQNFNQLLNEKYDFSRGFTQQTPSFLSELTHSYEAIQRCHKQQIQLTNQYFQLSREEREQFWQNYSGNVEQKRSYYEEFSALVDGSKELNEAQKLKTKADALQLMAYETGTKMIFKTVDNVKRYLSQNNPDNKFSIVAEGYSVGMNRDNSMKPAPELQKRIFEHFSWGNNFASFGEFKKLFRDKNNIKGNPTGVFHLSVNKDDNLLYVFTGIESAESNKIILFASPSYQSLYHELAHLNRALRGSGKSSFRIPSLFKDLYSNDVEEIWNINLGKSSDNTFQKERGAPLRISHSRAFTLTKKDSHLEVSENSLSPETDVVSSSLYNIEALFGRRDFKNLIPRNNQIVELSLQGIKEKVELSNSTALLSISSSTLTSSDLQNSDLRDFRVTFTNLTHCNFDNTLMKNAFFSQFCDLSYSQFKGADLKKAVFRDCDLSHCNFSGADLSQVRFEGKAIGIETCCFDNAILTDVLSPTLNDLVEQGEISVNKAIEIELQLSNTVKALETYHLADLDSIIHLLNRFKQDKVLLKMMASNELTSEMLVKYFRATGIYGTAIPLLQTKAAQTIVAQGDFVSFCDILSQEAHKRISLENLHSIFELLGNSDVLTTLMREKKLTLEQVHQIIKLDSYSAIEFFRAIHQYKTIRSFLLDSKLSIQAIIEMKQQKNSVIPEFLDEDEIDPDAPLIFAESVTCKSLLIEEVKKIKASEQTSQHNSTTRNLP